MCRVYCEMPADYDLNVNVGEMVVASVLVRKRASDSNEDGDHVEEV